MPGILEPGATPPAPTPTPVQPTTPPRIPLRPYQTTPASGHGNFAEQMTALGQGSYAPGPPGGQGPSGNIPGGREVWMIDGKLFLVWLVPVDADGDGEFDDTVPIGFMADAADLRNAGLSATPTVTLTGAQWDQRGGLEMGFMRDLNNTDRDPFDGFVETMMFQAELYPHLLDPGVMAATAAAWLMGRAVTEDDLLRTPWGQTHNAAERAWIVASSRDPQTAEQMITDNRLWVTNQLQLAGVSNASTELVNLLADRLSQGTWTDNYTLNQIQLLADPSMAGDLDPAVSDFFSGDTGFTLDTTRSREDTVRATVQQWLGPTFGNWTDSQITDWAGRLRQDPDAQQALEAMLSQQRLAMFPAYGDPTLTYEDISSPWRGLFQQTWGEIPDETDPFFNQIVNLNDSWEAQKVLLKEGLKRGIRTVTESALRDMYASMGGTQVVRMQ